MLQALRQPKQDRQPWGTLSGAVRLGERASIGFGTWTSAHGGAVESVLDEATAELTKMEWATMVSTIEARGLTQSQALASVFRHPKLSRYVESLLEQAAPVNCGTDHD